MKSKTLNDMVNMMGKDFDNYVRPVASGVKDATLGLLEGLYTPFLMSTGYRRSSDGEAFDIKSSTHIASAYLTSAGIMLYGAVGVFEGRWKETLFGLGALVATNVVDYLQNKYRKAKEIDKLHDWLNTPLCHRMKRPKRVYWK